MNPPTATPTCGELSCDECNARTATLETELAAAKAECERLKFVTEGHLLKTIQQQAELAHLRAEVERLKELLRIESASAQHALAAAERAEADSARLDWLLDRSAQTYHSYSNPLGGGNYVQYHKDRAAIDAAMKGTT